MKNAVAFSVLNSNKKYHQMYSYTNHAHTSFTSFSQLVYMCFFVSIQISKKHFTLIYFGFTSGETYTHTHDARTTTTMTIEKRQWERVARNDEPTNMEEKSRDFFLFLFIFWVFRFWNWKLFKLTHIKGIKYRLFSLSFVYMSFF